MIKEVQEDQDEILAKAYNKPLYSLPVYTVNKYRLIGAVLREILGQFPIVVELGCGNKLLAEEYLLPSLKDKKPRYIGIDKNELLRPSPDVLANILNVPLAQNIADAVVCLDVLEHLDITNLQLVLNEIARIAKPGAPIIITVPSMYNLDRFNNPAIRYGTHRTKFTPQQWVELIAQYIDVESYSGMGICETAVYLPQFLKFIFPESPGVECIVNRLYLFLRELKLGKCDPFLYDFGMHKMPIVKDFCSSIMLMGRKKK